MAHAGFDALLGLPAALQQALIIYSRLKADVGVLCVGMCGVPCVTCCQ
jgi:hypothetical protein